METLNEIYKKTSIKGLSSIDEVLEKVNGNWIAEPQELITSGGLFVPKAKAIVRGDNNKVLGVVGERYNIIQNQEAFSFFDKVVESNKATYQDFVELDGGQKTILTANYGEKQEVAKNDIIRFQIKLINSFNGTSSFKIEHSALRLVCTNGMTRNEKFSTVSVRHSNNKEVRMKEALNLLTDSESYYQDFLLKCQSLTQKALDSKMIDTFLNNLLEIDPELPSKEISTNKKNSKKEILHLANHGRGNKGESMWDLYNGSTEFVDHHKGSNSNKRLKSSTLGAGRTMKDRAFELALAA